MRIQNFFISKKFIFLSFITALNCCMVPSICAAEADAQLILKARQALSYADEEIALEILKPLANKGNSEAMMIMYRIFSRSGNQKLRNEVLADEILEKALNNKYPQALGEKARRYIQPGAAHGKKSDVAKAIVLYEEASNLGHAYSSNSLSNIYSSKNEIYTDYSKAFFFAKRAFEQKERYSFPTLARFYYEGIGTEPDLVKAYGLYVMSCYDFSNFSCDEAEKIAVKLNMDQKKSAKAYIEDLLKTYSEWQIARPQEIIPALTNATRADLLREYKLNSPLFSIAQYGNREKYSATNRNAFTYMLLLSQPLPIPAKQRNASNKDWKNLVQNFLIQLTNLDRKRLRETAKFLDDSESLLKKIDKELSDDELKYLVALYRSENSKKLYRAFQLIKDIEEDGNQRVWENLATSGKNIDDLHKFAQDYFADYQGKVSESKEYFEHECNLKYLELRNRVSQLQEYTFRGISSGSIYSSQLHIMMARPRPELIKLCAEDKLFDFSRVFDWKPVKHEQKIIYAWKVESVELPQVKEINAKFDAGLEKLLKENR